MLPVFDELQPSRLQCEVVKILAKAWLGPAARGAIKKGAP